jgi:hypothetical protein
MVVAPRELIMGKKSKPSRIGPGQRWREPNPKTERNETATVLRTLILKVEMKFGFTGLEIRVTEKTLNSRAWEFLSNAPEGLRSGGATTGDR